MFFKKFINNINQKSFKILAVLSVEPLFLEVPFFSY